MSRIGLAPTASALGLCTAGMCAASPAMLAGSAAAAVLGGALLAAHLTLFFVIAPLSLALLVRSFLRHRRLGALLVAGSGVLLVVAHYIAHLDHGSHGDEPLLYAGAALLFGGSLLDRYAAPRHAQRVLSIEAGPSYA